MAMPQETLDAVRDVCQAAAMIGVADVGSVLASMHLMTTVAPLVNPCGYRDAAQHLVDNEELVRIFLKFRRELERHRQAVLKRDVAVIDRVEPKEESHAAA